MPPRNWAKPALRFRLTRRVCLKKNPPPPKKCCGLCFGHFAANQTTRSPKGQKVWPFLWGPVTNQDQTLCGQCAELPKALVAVVVQEAGALGLRHLCDAVPIPGEVQWMFGQAWDTPPTTGLTPTHLGTWTNTQVESSNDGKCRGPVLKEAWYD